MENNQDDDMADNDNNGGGNGNNNNNGEAPALLVPPLGALHVPPMMEPAAAHLMAVVDGHHGNVHNGHAQPAAAAANHNNANGNANNNQNVNQNQNMTAEESAAAAVAAVIAAYEIAPDPPQTAEEERLSALRQRHYRNRQTLGAVLSQINSGRWEDLRRILAESEVEDRNQIFGVDNLGHYVAPLPFTVEMNRRRRTANFDEDDEEGEDDDNDHDGAIDVEEHNSDTNINSNRSHEPNAAVIAAATTASRTHAIDANVFQACCMSGRNVPVDILEQIVAINEGKALTAATKPPVSYRQRYRPHAGGAGGGGLSRFMHGEMIRREPIDIACVNGHAGVLKFILDEVGRSGNGSDGGSGKKNGTKTSTTMTPQQPGLGRWGGSRI